MVQVFEGFVAHVEVEMAIVVKVAPHGGLCREGGFGQSSMICDVREVCRTVWNGWAIIAEKRVANAAGFS